MRNENSLDIEMDFGAFALNSEEVYKAYECIKNINEEELRARYDFNHLLKTKFIQ